MPPAPKGANGIAFDRQNNLYVAGGRSGIVYRVGTNGGAAQPAVKIEPNVRKLPDGKTEQPIVANGVEFDSKGILYVSDTARGAIWKVEIGPDGKGGKSVLWAQSPLLEGADGLAFDGSGKLWVAANERNAIVTVTPEGTVQEVAKNGGAGPLEFPSAIVFVGNTAYITNFDTPDETIWMLMARPLAMGSALPSLKSHLDNDGGAALCGRRLQGIPGSGKKF